MIELILSGGRRKLIGLSCSIAIALTSCNSGGGGGGAGKPTNPSGSSGAPPLSLKLEAVSPLPDVAVQAGAPVTFRVELSEEHDAQVTRISWSIDGEPLDVAAAEMSLPTRDLRPGTHRVTARMTEGEASSTVNWNLDVAAEATENRAPFLLQAMPADQVTVSRGSVLTLSVAAADVDALDALQYIWQVDGYTLSVQDRSFDLDTSGLEPGDHSATVFVTDGFEHPGEPLAANVWRLQVLEANEPEPPRICGAWPMGSLRLKRRTLVRLEVEACALAGGEPVYHWDVNGNTQVEKGPSFDFDSSGDEGNMQPGVYRVTCRLLDASGSVVPGDPGVGWTVYIEPDANPSFEPAPTTHNLEPVMELTLPSGPVRAETGMVQCFQVAAQDPENDALCYRWLVNGKVQNTDGPILCWLPAVEEAERTVEVEVLVDDGHLHDQGGERMASVRLASWSVEVAATVEALPTGISGATVLDNGASGTSSTGPWQTSSASGAYGAGSVFSKSAGATYSYNLKTPLAGSYDVWLWWTSLPGRSKAVPVKISHRSGTASVKLDQRTRGGQWNKIGRFDFGATAKVVITSTGGDASTCADAVRLTLATPAGDPAGTPPIQAAGVAFVIDDGSPGTSSVGVWSSSSGTNPFGGISLYSDGEANSYSFLRPLASGGMYDVYAWWTQWPSRDPAVTYRINHSGGKSDVKVNQQVNGGQWNLLGRYTFGSNVLVSVIVPGTSTACADAVRFVPAAGPSTPAPTGEVIVDNGDKGTSSVGAWSASTAPSPFGSSSLYAKGSGAYTFAATLPAQGTYGVYVWYTQWSSRESAVPHEIVHAAGSSTVNVDQRSGGGQWKLLGDYSFGPTARVVVRVVDGDTVCADAIKFVARSGPAPAPPPVPSADYLTLAWDTPTRNKDGSALNDLSGFRVYSRSGSGAFARLADVGLATEYSVTALGKGTYTFAITAYDRSGNESSFSVSTTATVP